MKKLKYILPAFLFLFSACDKSLELETPSFNVKGYTVEAGVDELGNPVSKVTFDFEGDAKTLSMYSGEVLHDYDFIDGRILEYSDLNMSFYTYHTFGTQDNPFHVLYSTDFNGKYTPEDTNAARWDPITSNFTLSYYNNTGKVKIPSGDFDINSLKVEGKPLYIAFKYTCLPQAAAGVQSSWYVGDFSIKGTTSIGVKSLVDQTSAAWTFVNIGDIIDPNRSIWATNGEVRLSGNNINTEVSTESWAITRAIDTEKSNIGPDRPIVIKKYTDPMVNKYTYIYPKTGTYKVTFIAQNTTFGNEQKVLKTIDVTIN